MSPSRRCAARAGNGAPRASLFGGVTAAGGTPLPWARGSIACDLVGMADARCAILSAAAASGERRARLHGGSHTSRTCTSVTPGIVPTAASTAGRRASCSAESYAGTLIARGCPDRDLLPDYRY